MLVFFQFQSNQIANQEFLHMKLKESEIKSSNLATADLTNLVKRSRIRRESRLRNIHNFSSSLNNNLNNNSNNNHINNNSPIIRTDSMDAKITIDHPDEENVQELSLETYKKASGSLLACVSHGLISVIGRRGSMEDAVAVAPGVSVGEFGSYDFFAVYDGHGGARVANSCRDKMHHLVAVEVAEKAKGADDGGRGLDYWGKVMGTCFEKMDDEVSGGEGDGDDQNKTAAGTAASVKTMGSTAVVVMVGKEEIVVANCGDSRAVLCRGGVAVPLSRDHKPDRPDELERVEAAGGRVINWNGSRILGVLATSRAIGDQYMKPYVIAEPEVTVNQRTELDNFLVIATDGLWDVVANEAACEVVGKCLAGKIKRRFSDEFSGTRTAEAAAILAQLATMKGSKDNISVIVVELERPK